MSNKLSIRKRIEKSMSLVAMYYNNVIKAKHIFKVPLLTKIKMNLKGFTADQYVLYNLKENNIKEYISEFERWKTRGINGRYNLIADDKLIFEEIFGKYVNVPKNFAWIKNGIAHGFTKQCFTKDHLISLFKSEKKIILKPAYGTGGGRGIHLINIIQSDIYLDDRIIEQETLHNLITGLDDYIITEFIEQHDYSSKLFAKTTNTIRLVTIIDDEGIVSIPYAMHRIGLKSTIPVDNASKGGLISKINIETGELSEAKRYFDKNVYINHPDSGSRIEGVKIPFWNNVKEIVVEVAQKFPYIYFIAWDIVITKDSFSVIEINASSGLNIFQIWEGIRNTELGDFYKRHKVLE